MPPELPAGPVPAGAPAPPVPTVTEIVGEPETGRVVNLTTPPPPPPPAKSFPPPPPPATTSPRTFVIPAGRVQVVVPGFVNLTTQSFPTIAAVTPVLGFALAAQTAPERTVNELIVGASGGRLGIAVTVEKGPAPEAFIAFTRKEYVVPFVNPEYV